MAVELEMFGLIGILIVAVITPGPNNIIVFHAAITGGIRCAAPLIAGIVCGSLVLFICAALGIDLLFKTNTLLVLLLSILGSAYLVWLGFRLLWTSFSIDFNNNQNSILPNSFTAVAIFQFANPKSWVLMTVVSTKALPQMHWLKLVILLTVIFVCCLLLWAYTGTHLHRFIQEPYRLAWFNKIMGAALISFATILLWHGFRGILF